MPTTNDVDCQTTSKMVFGRSILHSLDYAARTTAVTSVKMAPFVASPSMLD